MQLFIDSEVLRKITFWVKKADDYEVSGLGKVEITPEGPKVTSAILLPQRNTQGHTEIEALDVSKAMFETKDLPGSLNFWWHSHGKGAVFFSQTDIDTIKLLGRNGYLIASVFNTHGDVRSSFLATEPFPHYVDNIELKEVLPTVLERPEWNEEYLGKVTKVSFFPQGRRTKLYKWDKVKNKLVRDKEAERAARITERTGFVAGRHTQSDEYDNSWFDDPEAWWNQQGGCDA